MEGIVLNIGGSEWVLIAFVALIVLLGTNRLPGVARRLGKLAGEYDKAKTEIRGHAEGMGGMRPTAAMGTEAEKLDAMAATLGIKRNGRTDEEMRRLISEGVGGKAGGKADA